MEGNTTNAALATQAAAVKPPRIRDAEAKADASVPTLAALSLMMLAELAGIALALWLLKAAVREPTNGAAK